MGNNKYFKELTPRNKSTNQELRKKKQAKQNLQQRESLESDKAKIRSQDLWWWFTFFQVTVITEKCLPSLIWTFWVSDDDREKRSASITINLLESTSRDNKHHEPVYDNRKNARHGRRIPHNSSLSPVYNFVFVPGNFSPDLFPFVIPSKKVEDSKRVFVLKKKILRDQLVEHPT